jgi:hypothetical protein
MRGIHLRCNRAREYMSLWLSSSNKGWHKQWFYLKNDTATPLPVFSGRLVEETMEQSGWGVLEKDKKKIGDHHTAIVFLKERGLRWSGITGAYHMRRKEPLMAPSTLPEGMVLAEGALTNAEIAQHIKEVMEAV